MINKKQCCDCKKLKSLDEFSRSKAEKDGRIYRCKKCDSKRRHDYYIEHREKMIERDKKNKKKHKVQALQYGRKYNKTHQKQRMECNKNRRIETCKIQKKYSNLHPEKIRAHNSVRTALRNGTLIRRSCEFCGSVEKSQAHHGDYSKPLDITWLCKECHTHLHIRIREGVIG